MAWNMEEINLMFAKKLFTAGERIRVYKKLMAYSKNTSLIQALAMIADNASDGGRKKTHPTAMIVTQWKLAIEDGLTLGEAVRGWIPEAEQIMIASGDKSNPTAMFGDLIMIMNSKKTIRKTITGGMAYPLFLAFAGVIFLLYFALETVPQFSGVFPITRWTGAPYIMAVTSLFVLHYIIFIGLGIFGVIFLISYTMPRWKGGLRKYFDKVPPWSLYRLYNGASFMLILSSLSKAGMPTKQILMLIRLNASPWLDERMRATQAYVEDGFLIGDALYETKYNFPDAETVRDLKAFCSQADFAAILRNMGEDWITEAVEKIQQQTAIMKQVAFAFVGLIVCGFVAGIIGLEMQVASFAQSGG